MSIGLKDGLKTTWKINKGCRLRRKLSELYWEIKYAFKRAWYGYDDRDIFDMDYMFIDRYKVILKRYREMHNCLFNVPEEYKDFFNKLYFNEEETDAIIDTMIYHLDMMDEDNVKKKLYGTNVYDKDYDFKKFSIHDHKRVWTVVEQNKNAFMKLFSLFFWDLWY